jgi:hypothetical protein
MFNYYFWIYLLPVFYIRAFIIAEQGLYADFLLQKINVIYPGKEAVPAHAGCGAR